jgi:predicted acetyltransferase
MCILVPPSLQYRQTLLEAFEEFQANGENLEVDLTLLAERLEELLAWIEAQQDPSTVDPGQLPFFDYWLIDHEEWIGKLTLRPQINEQFLVSGGHIGYEIRPSKRRQGYGTLLLRLGLEKAREHGLCRVLLTCDETNVGSKKIIQANGGRYENAVPQEGTSVKKLRYWIDLCDEPLFRRPSGGRRGQGDQEDKKSEPWKDKNP